MKILFITPWYPDQQQPHSGVFIKTLAQALARQHQVYVLSVKVDYSSFHLFKFRIIHSEEGNLHEYRLVIARSLPFVNQLVQLLVAWWQARHLFKEEKISILHSFIGYPGSVLGYLVSKSLNIPYVHTEHTKLINNYRSLWHRFCTQWGMKRANRITAVSQWLANQITVDIQRPVQVIPNMIDVNRFKVAANSQNTTFNIGFLGGLNTPVKGLDILLKAFAQVDGDCHLHIGGAGALLEHYKGMAKDLGLHEKCTFYGFINPEATPAFYQQLHLFICSSRYETFNVSLLEAMASGLPVISTKCGGPEGFVNSENGLLIPVEDIKALREAIEYMRSSFHEFDRMKIRLFVESHYASGVVVQQVQELYETVMKDSLQD